MRALFPLFLVLATLHAQTPGWFALGPADHCACHHGDEPDPADHDSLPSHPPGGCPVDCPCMFCSPGFVPLTDFGTVTLPVETAFGPPLAVAAASRGHAGHHQLPDRPPRAV